MRRILIAACAIGAHFASAQGCSDAGFCTMGAMKPDQPFNKKVEFKLRSMELSFYRGTTTTSPEIYVVTADLNFSITRKTFFQFKVPYLAADGNFGNTSGLSDLSLCFTHALKTTDKLDVNISIGGKIPTNKANLETEGRPFPMYYQTSLGTYDFITGVSVKTRSWLFATGLQLPVIHQNENEFTWTTWPNYPDQNYVKTYSEAYKLRRGTDVMLRVERNFRFSQFNFSFGALPIYRIKKDQLEDPATGEPFKLEGTTGLALSLIGTFGYSFNVRSGVRMLYGKKLTDREVNPDGLTRNDVVTFSYYYRF